MSAISEKLAGGKALEELEEERSRDAETQSRRWQEARSELISWRVQRD